MTSSVIYYSTDTRKNEIYLLNIILLPNPRMKLLPRGRIQEELYVRGFVATAVTITNEMTASEIEGQFATLFSNKLKGRPFYSKSVAST